MRPTLSLLALALGALAATASPVPADDPANVDVCGLDSDLEPQASLDAPFKLRVQREDLSNEPQHLGLAKYGFVTRYDDKDFAATLKDNVLRSVASGYPVGLIPIGFAGFGVGPYSPKGGAKQKPLSFQARYVCDTMTKEPFLQIELVQPETERETSYVGFASEFSKKDGFGSYVSLRQRNYRHKDKQKAILRAEQ